VATALPDLPRYLVLEPVSTVRLEIRLAAPACEIDVELESPRPGRSFVLLIGHKEGPYVQRVRLSGKARIHFDPQSPGDYLLLLANPNREPLVLRLRGKDLGVKRGSGRKGSGTKPAGRRLVSRHSPSTRALPGPTVGDRPPPER
jgi:hypothetical protein